MEKSKVVLLTCKDYEEESVNKAIEDGINLLGGIELLFKREEKILLKPNLLAKASPEKAVTTHPAVFKAVGKLLKEHGYDNLYYGDSPGNPIGGVERVAAGCGIKKPAEELNIIPADFNKGTKVEFKEGITEQSFIISNGILECDGIINICKMKTHQLERITGAAKNMFGAVYGLNKGAFHAKFTDADSFARMIADLNNFIKPRLHIMDGVIAMEGNGPQSGTPVEMGLILMSKDPIALDTVFCNLINLKPELVPTNRFGYEYGVGTMKNDDIEIDTVQGCLTMEDAVRKYGNEKYNVYRGTDRKTQIKLLQPIQPLLQKKPYIIKDKCVKCGICVDSCPVDKKAITLESYPQYNYKLCIRCYCCQEMCPQKAIDVKAPFLARIMDRNWKL
ncbi:DUF362 domain-containing protein [Aminipila terrae]|uniref:Ferredoxin n=1 Tax=Aminipila terrae TaxID=2697030 RepID=A0A6P1MJS0_9FIRM|nr:DUF362 domain-containing protein [Aminipila terrae]QHI72278.1 DUF362 domain-containing protein [Aminipila terrae]